MSPDYESDRSDSPTLSKFNVKMSSVDYTPVLLAQVTDLQMRLTKQDSVIAALQSEVERLTGRSLSVPDSAPLLRTSVPLAPRGAPRQDARSGGRTYQGRDERGPPTRVAPRDGGAGRPERFERSNGTSGGAGGGADRPNRPRPRVAPTEGDKASGGRPSMTLADVLKKDEEVSMEVRTGKDDEGNDTHATVEATFDGSDLVVEECELVPSLVGMKSAKPGEILYKFIDELKSAGHIKRTFTIAPWRLCFVERGGARKSLEELRSTA